MPNISYTEEGSGEVILFLHGWGQNKEMMTPLTEDLKYKYKCVTLDLPGFGESSFNNEKNLDEYVNNIKMFLDQKCIKPKYVVGHSFGGKVAFNYYLKDEDIRGLVFIASPLLKPKRGIGYYYKIYKYKIKKKLHLKSKNAGSEDYKNCSTNMKNFFVNVVNTHFDDNIKNVKVPVLLVWGKDDEKVPLSKAKKLNNLFWDSNLYIEKGGHFAYLENIEFTKIAIQSFLRRNNHD